MRYERLLEELRARLDIVEVISDYVALKRSGQNYKGLCPFHSEKTPSFMVHPAKQIYHCFGCGVGGDAVGFVMKYENLTFRESLEFLAKRAGIDMTQYSPRRDGGDDERRQILAALRDAAGIFAANLGRSKQASAYLRDRGITAGSILDFSLGYAMKDWHALGGALRDKGYPDPVLLRAGILSSGDKGVYDIFRDRIMFPITDVQGEVIAFGGRVMGEGLPKYLNSPDTPLFHKGETLYGLHQARDGVRERGYALIVEGYFDVIVLHKYGFTHAVAPLGTAFTAGHLRRLKRFTGKAVLVFDGDAAGVAAARRSLPVLLQAGFAAKILLLPEKEDPDSFLRRQGSDAFGKLLARSRSVVEFLLSGRGKERTELAREAIGIIAEAADPIMRETLIDELAKKTGMSEPVIREEMRRNRQRTQERGAGSAPSAGPLVYDEEVLLLSALLVAPGKAGEVLRAVSDGEIRNPAVRGILGLFRRLGGAPSMEKLLPELDSGGQALVTALTVHPGFDPEIVDRNIEDCVRKIALRKFAEKQREAAGTDDPELHNALLIEKRKLIKEAR